MNNTHGIAAVVVLVYTQHMILLFRDMSLILLTIQNLLMVVVVVVVSFHIGINGIFTDGWASIIPFIPI